MTIIAITINDKDAYFEIPLKTAENMLEEPNLVNEYFEEAAKKSYFDVPPTTSASKEASADLHIGKFDVLSEVPDEIHENDIVKIGWWKNRKIMKRVRKRRGNNQADLPVDVVQKCIGIFGRWHMGVCLMIFLCKFPVGFHQLSIIFLAPQQEFRCAENGTIQCSPDCTSYEYDTFGRKMPLIFEVLLQATTGLLTAFVPWFWAFMILRFLAAAATGGTMITSFVLIMEIVGLKRRTIVSILYQVPMSLGHAMMSLISYYLREWRKFQIAISAPSFFLLSYYFLIPESPRWLLLVGKRDKAIDMLSRAAKHNGLPTDSIAQDVDNYLSGSSKKTTKKGNVLDLFRSAILRTYTLVLCFNWLVCCLGYYGLSQFIGKFGGDIFIKVMISGLTQIPSLILAAWLTNAWGRKWTMIVANVITGISLLLMIITPSEPIWIHSLFVLTGISGTFLGFPTIYIWSGELFPTPIRNSGMGICSMSGRVGSMIAPFVADIQSGKGWMSPFIFGVVPLIGAALCYFLPETLNCQLPKSIEDVENLEMARKKARR
ncbi:solute carrier family 22 member 13-like isoform X2 [Leptinotarsa decemlineata]|uniref:solute carrier family 22 member 13-like isoform X2 n=1 Tax=Leptinotarsa decemlineata TaxID=7539 RepID=UPI003D304A7C